MFDYMHFNFGKFSGLRFKMRLSDYQTSSCLILGCLKLVIEISHWHCITSITAFHSYKRFTGFHIFIRLRHPPIW